MTHRLAGAFLATLALLLTPALAADAPREPYGINLEGFSYPYPVSRTAAWWCCCTGAISRQATGRP